MDIARGRVLQETSLPEVTAIPLWHLVPVGPALSNGVILQTARIRSSGMRSWPGVIVLPIGFVQYLANGLVHYTGMPGRRHSNRL